MRTVDVSSLILLLHWFLFLLLIFLSLDGGDSTRGGEGPGIEQELEIPVLTSGQHRLVLTSGLIARDGDDTLLFDVQLHLWVTAPDMLPTMVDTQNHSVAQPPATSHCALSEKVGEAGE